MGTGFEGFVLFGFMSLLLLLGTLVRAKVPLFQSYLVPASIIAGLLGFAVIAGANHLNGTAFTIAGVPITHKAFNQFVFHAFNISFMSLLLTPPKKGAALPKAIVKGGMWQTCVWTISLGGQALVGGLIIYLYNIFTGGSLTELIGFISTHGYTQGPGQAYAMGLIWAKDGPLPEIVTIGLIYAAMGFFSAVIVGVPFARWLVKKGLNTNKRAALEKQFLTGIMDKNSTVTNGRETTHAANIDTLAFHLAALGITYLLTYLELTWLEANVRPLLLGSPWLKGFASLCSLPMFFIHGLIMGYFVRKVLEMFRVGHLIDPVVQTRITGASVDYLVVATLVAIEFQILKDYALPIFLVCVGVTLFTLAITVYFGRHGGEYGPERAATQFGCCCGSTASGILLLRIMDPDFSTPVAVELGFFNVAILFTCAPILFFFAPALPGFSFWEVIAIYTVFTTAAVGLLLALGLFKKKNSWETAAIDGEDNVPGREVSSSMHNLPQGEAG